MTSTYKQAGSFSVQEMDGVPLRCIVTGASRGFGRAIALALADAGHRVVGGSRTTHDTPPSVAGLELDLSQPASTADFAKAALDILGGVDVVVNNAALPGPVGRIASLARREWEETFAVNMFGVVQLTGLLAGHMKARRTGTILNIGSRAGHIPLEYVAPYCTSKAALHAYTLCLAFELGPFGVRANTLGIAAETHLSREHRLRKARLRGRPDHRGPLPAPEDNLPAALFLLSKAAGHINGQYLEANSLVGRP